jgi:WD40 repeat protein
MNAKWIEAIILLSGIVVLVRLPPATSACVADDAFVLPDSSGVPRQAFVDLAISANEDLVAAAGTHVVCVWDISKRTEPTKLHFSSAFHSTTAFSSTDNLLATGSMDGTAYLWRAPDWKQLATLPQQKYGAKVLRFSPDGKLIASGSANGVLLWDSTRQQSMFVLPKHGVSWVPATLSFSPSGKTLAVLSFAPESLGVVEIWDLEKRTLIKRMDGEGKIINTIAFSPDGRRFLLSLTDYQQLINNSHLRFRDTATWEVVRTIPSGRGQIASVDFSPDSRLLAVAGGLPPARDHASVESMQEEHAIRLLDPEKGKEVIRLKGHVSTPTLKFFRDGRRLASAGRDGTVRIWDIRQRLDAID